METYFLILSLAIFFFISLKLLFDKPHNKFNLPPSPARPLPLIGHLHLLKQPLHRTFLSFSQSLDSAPIFSLRLGNRLAVVVSSYSIAEECFTKNDIVLANRPDSIVGKYIEYNFTTVTSAPYGDHWRNLRRLSTLEIFSSHKLNGFLSVRKDEIRHLLLRLSKNSQHQDDNALRVRQLIDEVVSYAGAGNATDYIPILRWITSFEKRVKNLAGRVDEFLQSLVDEKRADKEKGDTMMDHLLSLQEIQPNYYTDITLKGIIVVMILAGTETLTGTLEWAMLNLLNHPEVLRKTRTEIDTKIGFDRFIDEQDIKNLPYLQGIVLETLRLHPVAPTLVPHMTSDDCILAGYDVPCRSMLLVNVWAMHRDPSLWEDPEMFKPERIGEEYIDTREAPMMRPATPLQAMCKTRPI
ncbi:hypothetical protein EUTSA_v10000659mg, partial [Eutrema salsugineum]